MSLMFGTLTFGLSPFSFSENTHYSFLFLADSGKWMLWFIMIECSIIDLFILFCIEATDFVKELNISSSFSSFCSFPTNFSPWNSAGCSFKGRDTQMEIISSDFLELDLVLEVDLVLDSRREEVVVSVIRRGN